MNSIFLDTVGLIALWDRRDQWHTAAKSALSAIDLSATSLVTSTFVLLECANHAARKPYRLEVVRLRDQLTLAGALYEPLPDEVFQAWIAYGSTESGTSGIVDLTSFSMMRRLGMSEVFGNDRHFAAAGFKNLF